MAAGGVRLFVSLTPEKRKGKGRQAQAPGGTLVARVEEARVGVELVSQKAGDYISSLKPEECSLRHLAGWAPFFAQTRGPVGFTWAPAVVCVPWLCLMLSTSCGVHVGVQLQLYILCFL